MNRTIENYRRRRDSRLRHRGIHRFDEEEAENKPQNTGRRFRGNTRLPYGLAKGEGIDTEGMRPKDVWEALEGKGYSAPYAYAKLKEGKHGKDLKTEKPKEHSKPKHTKTVSESDFSVHFKSAPARKSIKVFAEELNKSEVSDNILELVSKFQTFETGAELREGLKTIMTADWTSSHFCSWSYAGGLPAKAALKVPNLDKCSPNEKKYAVRTFLHEYVHMIDYGLRSNKYKSGNFTDNIPESLKGSLGTLSYDSLSDDMRKLVEDSTGRIRAVKDELDRSRKEDIEKIENDRKEKKITYSEYLKLWDARWKKYNKESSAAVIKDDGASLCNLLDALSGGKMFDSGKVLTGHGSSYFEYGTNKRGMLSEAIAIYAELQFSGGKDIEIFRRDYPEIAKGLDDIYEDMVKHI